jgi:hypothetical protein
MRACVRSRSVGPSSDVRSGALVIVALLLGVAALFGAGPAAGQGSDTLVDGAYEVTDHDLDTGPSCDGCFAAANAPLANRFTASGCSGRGCTITYADITGPNTMTVRSEGGGSYTGTWTGNGCSMDVTMKVSGDSVSGSSTATCGGSTASATWTSRLPSPSGGPGTTTPGSATTAPSGGQQGAGGGGGSTGHPDGTQVDAGVDPLTPRQEDSAAAIERGERSTVPAALQTPSEAFGDAGQTIGNALLAGVVVLLLVFPAELFNSTFDENQDRIRVDLSRFSGRKDRPGVQRSDARGGRAALAFAAVTVTGAVIGGFLDPNFGLDGRSIALVVGVLVAIVARPALSGMVGRTFLSARNRDTVATLRAVPLGLAVAAACVLVSRLTHFQPGYLYGLVGGLAFAAALDDREDGQLELLAVGTGVLVAMLAWFASVPVGAASNDGNPGFALQVADSVTGSLFIATIEGLLFGLIPLRFLPGSRIMRWSRPAWALAMFAVAFMFVQVLLRPSTGYLGRSSTASVAVTVGLLLAFGLASVTFWAWFRFRPAPGERHAADAA